jgi:hypothetical protein
MSSVEEIIRDAEEAEQKLNNWKPRWQDISDLERPLEDQIANRTTAGQDKSYKVFDDSPMQYAVRAASGLFAAMVPSPFFDLCVGNPDIQKIDRVRRYMAKYTAELHRAMFDSNFPTMIGQTLLDGMVFGTGNLYREWNEKDHRLNYKNHAISSYTIEQDCYGRVDTVRLYVSFSARQAVQRFGAENLHEKIIKDAQETRSEEKRWKFVWIVKPRSGINPLLSKKFNGNMPFESAIVDMKNRCFVEQTGYMYNPFSVWRWTQNPMELYGRGPGGDALASVRLAQQLMKDFINVANLQAEPPYTIPYNHEGTVNRIPNGITRTDEPDKIKPLMAGFTGNYQVTKDFVQYWNERIQKAFFLDVFNPITPLTGDRRTTNEIRQRISEGLRGIVLFARRIESELLDPTIIGSAELLWENEFLPQINAGTMEPPPPELQGQTLKVEYTSPLAQALRDQQASGILDAVEKAANMSQFFPGIMDNFKPDAIIRLIAASRGVDVDCLASDEEMAAIRQQRAKMQQAQQAVQLAEQAGNAYKSGTKAPEDGSAAQKLMESANA